MDFAMGRFAIEGSSFQTPASPRMVNVELKRYRAISVHGGSTTSVTQRAGPACHGDREVLGGKHAVLFRSTPVSVRTIKMPRDEYHMSTEIDVTSLTTCQVAPEGDYVCLNFEDALGRPATLRLTSACVQKLVMTLPHLLSEALRAQHGDRSLRAVFPLGAWRLEAAGSKDLILTMMTPDGFEVAFSLGAPAIARIASALEEHCPMVEQGSANLAS
jgi:hypothetical protein